MSAIPDRTPGGGRSAPRVRLPRGDPCQPAAAQPLSAAACGGGGPFMNRFPARVLARAATGAVLTTATLAAALITASPVFAADPTYLAVNTIPQVLDQATKWLMGILAAVATLFLTIGGVRYVTAGGDPGEVEKAKSAFKSAGVGYALAALAPIVVGILKSILGVA